MTLCEGIIESGPWGTRQCCRKALSKYGDKHYCKSCSPPEKMRRMNIHQIQQEVLVLAAKFHTTLDSGTPVLWMMSEGPDELFEAVGKLKSLGWEPENE